VAFVANRYTPLGADKGYDLFVAAAIELGRRHANISFHVVGGFDRHVIDVSELGDRIKFYGFREISFFDEFYRTIDIFVSPNRASVLSPGGFDGFPTGTAVDAVLRGPALICSDPLGLNMAFSPGDDLILVETTQEAVVLAVENLMADPVRLDAIARRGRGRFREVFGPEVQLRPRLAVLNSLINPACG
jgi:glycosyltransferase involved in cell wall biosynthesis